MTPEEKKKIAGLGRSLRNHRERIIELRQKSLQGSRLTDEESKKLSNLKDRVKYELGMLKFLGSSEKQALKFCNEMHPPKPKPKKKKKARAKRTGEMRGGGVGIYPMGPGMKTWR